MTFETDVLISYAHIDNQTQVEGDEGWISNLHRALEVRVAQLRGETTDVWRDPKLQGNDVFAETLLHKLPGVAVLISVVSPRYVKSEWCVREVEEFCRASAATGGLQVGDKARIFKVLKTPVPLDHQPPPVQPLLGYEFFKVDPQTGRARELDKAFGPEAQQEFWTRLEDLAQDIAALLESMEGEADGGDGGAAAADTPSVYLAEATLDLRDDRDALRRFLQREACGVYPKSSLPLHVRDLEAAVRADLAACRVSIHPVGKSYGMIPEGSTESVEVLQCRLALERSREAELDRVLWLPAGSGVEDPRQRDFIEYLRSDSEILQGADLLERPLEDLKGAVRTLLEKLSAAEIPRQASAGSEGDTAVVYLICDPLDLEATTAVRDLIFDRGYEVILPVFEGDETDLREEHEESLRSCDGVLIYYGAGSEIWQRRKLREIRKIAGYGRDRPIDARAILVAPPDHPSKSRLRSHEALVIDVREGALTSALEPFFEQLGQARKVASR